MSPMNRAVRRAACRAKRWNPIFSTPRRRIGLIVTGGIGVDHPAAIGAPRTRPARCRCSTARARGLAADRRSARGRRKDRAAVAYGTAAASGTGSSGSRIRSTFEIWGPPGRALDAPRSSFSNLRGVTDAEIVEIIGMRGSARNPRAQFDGIAIHGSNNNLPDAFLWEETNRRTDRWVVTGGRSTFTAEVVRAIRREAGRGVADLLPVLAVEISRIWMRSSRVRGGTEEVLGPWPMPESTRFDASQLR